VKLTTQLAVVICVGILTMSALVFGLAVYAHWSDGAIVGLIGVAGGALGTLIVQLRSNAKLADQDKTLDTIVRQTNGLSETERQDIAMRAARAVLDSQKGRDG
jgi:D-arabinose 1-dehydrogenase-like Zn-dependent alcohol dehydrogenase